MNYKMIACKVLQRELSFLCAKCNNFIDLTYLRQGFHNTPELLRSTLQAEIDAVESGCDPHSGADIDFDAILIGYGLCSNGISGISSKKYKLVIPKAHDCITLLLGSKENYKEYFDNHSGGIYWYSAGWMENTLMPSKKRFDLIYKEYEEKFGTDNAEYLMEAEQGWMTRYTHCAYINWNELEFPAALDYSKECARYLNWEFDLLQGSPALLCDLIDGKWDSDRFIVIPPGHTVTPSQDSDILSFV